MPDIIFRLAQRSDVPQLAQWLVRICENPKHHCMHSWSGEDAVDLGGLLLKYLADGELVYVLAFQGENLVGAMGCEYDEELHRGWLHGPHAEIDDWESPSEELFARVLEVLPSFIATLDAYPNTANVRAVGFYGRRGFAKVGDVSHVYGLTPGDRVASREAPCRTFQKCHEPSFLELFGALFPNAYYSGRRILNMVGSSCRVFVIAEGVEVLGFAAGCTDEGSKTGEVQFVGVREDRRGKGLGRRLLRTAVDWLFDDAAVSEVLLNVRQDVPHARNLYESVGFRRRHTGIGLRKTVSVPRQDC